MEVYDTVQAAVKKTIPKKKKGKLSEEAYKKLRKEELLLLLSHFSRVQLCATP